MNLDRAVGHFAPVALSVKLLSDLSCKNRELFKQLEAFAGAELGVSKRGSD